MPILPTPAPYENVDYPGLVVRERGEYVRSVGADPESDDDTEFGTDWVYCGAHRRVHETGWCTVSNGQKTPLNVQSYNEGMDLAREHGFSLYMDDVRS